MKNRYSIVWAVVFLIPILLLQVACPPAASARKLKVYSLPKSIVPGQLGIIVFENPDPTHSVTRASCTADRLIGWVKSDIPILRIEQNGKQVWTALGSYQTVGDSCIATFMAPVIFTTGRAALYLVNGSDPSIPYYFTISAKPGAILTGVEGGVIKPLTNFRIVGDGFVPEGSVNEKKARAELEENIGLSKLSPAEQWTALNHRVMKDWDKLPTGNFLYIEQGGKSWRGFVESCGLNTTSGTPAGMTLEFNAPPDIVPGPITLTLGIRMNGAEVFKTIPITATVSQ
ncbi:MAG TPA: hypothetical protein VFD13_07270 [Candidatus Kapabacteria bacterium]|nr:hypothetical protein [Candidatus Kapabacteria bacterium]